MRKAKFVFIFIFIFFINSIGYSLGKGSGATQKVKIEKCPDGYEFGWKKSYGCYPKKQPNVIDKSCTKQIVELYLAQRSCIIDNDQKGCSQLGLLYLTMPSSALIGAGAGKVVADAFNKILSSQIGLTQSKKLIDSIQNIEAADDQIRRLVTRDGTNYTGSQAEKELFGKTFSDHNERNRFIAKMSTTKTFSNIDKMYVGDLKEVDPEGYKKATDLMEKYEKLNHKIYMERVADIGKSNTNPLIKQLAEEKVKFYNDPELERSFFDAKYKLKVDEMGKAFGADVAKEAERLWRGSAALSDAEYNAKLNKG